MTPPGWLLPVRTGVLLLFAWSLPVSLFGMQAGVVLGALVLGVAAVLARGRGFGKTPLDAAILVHLAAVVLSLLFAPEGNTSLFTAGTSWVVAAYYVTWFTLDREQNLTRALVGVLLLACGVAAFAVYQSLTGRYPLGDVFHPDVPVLLKPVPGMPGRVGGVGLFFSRLTLAHVLLFPFCWATALVLEPLRIWKRLLLAGAVLIIAAGLYFTWTRATLVVAAVAAAGLLLTRLRSAWWKKLVAVGVLGCVVAGAVLLSPGMRSRIGRSFAGTRDWGRLVIWQTALDMASEQPLTGFGNGNFQRVSEDRMQRRVEEVGETRFPGIVAWAHSNLLSFLAEGGALAAFAFCFLFVLYFRRAREVLARLPRDRLLLRGFVRGSMAGAGCFLATGCFHDTWFDGEVIFTLWFALAASLAAGRLAEGAGEGAT